jgi:hypothetical protein
VSGLEGHERIVELLRKLKALAEDSGATPAEAELAAERMQALAFKHNIDVARLGTAPVADEYVQSVRFRWALTENDWDWQLMLLTHIGHNNFCEVIYRRAERTATFVGSQGNIEIAEFMYFHLARVVAQLGNKAVTAEKKRLPWPLKSPRAWRRAFCLGAINAIVQRLSAQRQEAVVEMEVNAIVVATEAKLEQAVQRLVPGARKGAGRKKGLSTREFGNAWWNGHKAGQEVELQKAVAG